MSKSLKPATLSQQHPIASRKTTKIIQSAQGQIVKIDAANYGIQSPGATAMLLPVNLPENYHQEGLKIVFSGNLKEIGLNEMMAGQPLMLTELHQQ